MPKVTMPDGSELDVPDDLTPEMGQRLRAYHDSMLAKQNESSQPTREEPAIDFDKLLGRAKTVGKEGLAVADSAVKGLVSIPKMVVDAGATISALGDKHLPDSLKVPGATQALQKISGFLTPIPASTDTGKALSNIASSTTGALVSPGSAAVNATIGASAGVGGETAAKVFGDNPVSRIAGSILGGGIAGIKTATKGNEASLAREALEDFQGNSGRQELARAMSNMKEAREAGIPINLSQALDRPSNVDAYTNALAQSAQGKNTANLLRAQPERIQDEAKRIIDKLPGTIQDNLTTASVAKDAAKARFQQLGDENSEVWKQALEKSKLNAPTTATGDEIVDTLNKITTLQKDYTPRDTEHRMLKELHDRLFNDGNVLTDPEKIHRTIRGFKADMDGETNKSAAKFVKGKANEFVENIAAMQPYREADKAYSKFANVMVNPLRKSIVGTIAGKKNAPLDSAVNSNQLESMFRRGTQQGGNSQILQLADEFKKAEKPEAFINAAKSYLANRADEAFRSADNRVNPDTAKNLKKAIGSDLQIDNIARGTNDILVGLARSKGIKDETAYANGFKKFMNVVARSANRPTSVSGTNYTDIVDKAGDHLLKRTGQFSMITPLRQPILWWSEKLKSDSLTTIDRLINSPEGVAMLVTLGQQNKLSHKAQTAISTYLSTQAQLQNATQQ